MKKLLCIVLLFIIVATGCNVIEPEKSQEVEVLAENLQIPWSMEKHGDTFYLSERPGHIITVKNGVSERHTVELKKELSTAPEAGLLGFVLSPDFQETQLAYAYYTYQEGDHQLNRIVTLRFAENRWSEESLLVDGIPSGTYHHGGRLKFGPDGYLYATTGDASVPDLAQDLDSLAGKILRMNLDGSIPSDNPFANSYIYSLGHRNPQGLTWSSDGTLYASEHGNRANDEVNKIEAGKNYGWPVIEGTQEQEGMVSPLFTSGQTNTWAPSGMAFHDGKLYLAALRGSAIFEFNLETGEQREVFSGVGRIRDVLIENDSLYFITNNTDGRGAPADNDDRLLRIKLK